MVIAGAPAFGQSDAHKSFNQIKTLTGSWEGKTSEGKPVTVDFRDTTGGSSIMSEIHGMDKHGMGKEDMVTMFYLDGSDKLMLTHYCGAGKPAAHAALQLRRTARV